MKEIGFKWINMEIFVREIYFERENDNSQIRSQKKNKAVIHIVSSRQKM